MLKKEIVSKEIKKAKDLKTLEQIYKKYLGKRGEISLVFRTLKDLPKEKRAKIAKEANEIKVLIEKELKMKSEVFKKRAQEEYLEKEKIDVTLPGRKIVRGHLHPLTLVKRKAEEIFQSMGFSVAEGPEVENEWYNFDALNIPKEHPARDLWDTFWLKSSNRKLQVANRYDKRLAKSDRRLLRAHTSPVQIRYMEKNNPPLRIIAPGRVFRHEATDASHDVQFYQLEGLMVGKDISLANLKAVITEFLKRFYKKEIKTKFRPSYFPFVEPGLETVISEDGKKWIEIIGSGMVHPNVFKAVGYNPKDWQGFAFGMGIDRLAMMKYKINDIRLFYSGDLRFLRQF